MRSAELAKCRLKRLEHVCTCSRVGRVGVTLLQRLDDLCMPDDRVVGLVVAVKLRDSVVEEVLAVASIDPFQAWVRGRREQRGVELAVGVDQLLAWRAREVEMVGTEIGDALDFLVARASRGKPRSHPFERRAYLVDLTDGLRVVLANGVAAFDADNQTFRREQLECLTNRGARNGKSLSQVGGHEPLVGADLSPNDLGAQSAVRLVGTGG